MTRAEGVRILREQRFVEAKFNDAFVMMEYFGYPGPTLMRLASPSGSTSSTSLGQLRQAEMVKAFIVSGEYRVASTVTSFLS